MRFFAHLKLNSFIHKQWLAQRRLGGQVNNVLFAKRSNGRFESNELSTEQVAQLKEHPAVELEAVSVLPAASTLPPLSAAADTGLPADSEVPPVQTPSTPKKA